MRVVLTHPSCWPYVRRGSERYMEEWFLYLLAKGYDAITFAGHPGGMTEQPPRKVLRPVGWRPWMRKFRIEQPHCFSLVVWRHLMELNPDVVHSWYFYDSLVASLRKREGRFRTVLQMNGVLVPGVSAHRFWLPEGRLIKEAMRRADELLVCSQFVREMVREHYGKDCHVVVPPMNLERWSACRYPRLDPPVILGIADFNQRRKGVRVLVKAFAILKQEMPKARLRLSGYLADNLRVELFESVPAEIRQDIEILGVGKTEDIPRLYAEASVTVLPSMWEPSGSVMMESWACGTPVVATRHGGLPEFFGEGVGYLFDPQTEDQETHNDDGLAEALYRGIRLSQTEGVRERCRAHANQFSMEALGPKIERLYRG